VGWTGPYPTMSKKRPTASLVSRKVLVPLLGQMMICILVQAIGFVSVQNQPWSVLYSVCTLLTPLMSCRYKPPKLNKQKSNAHNSQNTTLFLVSCYQYILSAVVLSVGRPFRQSMAHNCTYYPYNNMMTSFTDSIQYHL
jgi:cation-transporting P-type ATPase 13A2